MSNTLHQLIYCSDNVISNVDLHENIQNILACSRINNRNIDVTGALLFSEVGFAQVLEGSRESVESTFETIAVDRRHSNITILFFREVEQRSFPNWSMAYAGKLNNDEFQSILPSCKDLPSLNLAGCKVLDMLENMLEHETV